jgi:FkbM family methyltransferase
MKKYKNLINIIDVGCGQDLDEEWKRNRDRVDFFLGFDPGDNVEVVKKEFPNGVIYNRAVFDEEGERLFYFCNYDRCSSLFPPNVNVVKKYVREDGMDSKKVKRFNCIKKKKVQCIRLDTVISDLSINFDFIKIDTQGADYNVIKSLGEYLETQIIGIKTEAFFEPLYEGIKLYSDINNLLKSSGFKCVKKIPISSGPRRKFVSDFLYIRNDDNKIDKIKLIKKVYKV